MATTLYHFWRSSSSWRVRWALLEKGVLHRLVSVDLRAGEQHEATHRARNPMSYVPTLEIDGKLLGESVAILEFLEERFPEPALYPKDPWARARARQVVELINSGVQPMQNLSVLARVSPDAAAQKEWARHFNERGLAALERLLGTIAAEGAEEGLGGRFSVGNALTAADLFVVPQVMSARRFGVDVSRFPRVLAVEAAALETPHAEGARPERFAPPGAD